MFKWKVSRLGSKKEKDRSKQKLNNEIEHNEEIYAKNNNNNKDKKEISSSPTSRKFGLFTSNGTKTENTNTMTLSRVGQRLAIQHPEPSSLGLSNENILGDIPPPLPPLKPEWRTQLRLAEQEEAIPSDSLYGLNRNHSLSMEQRPEQRPPIRRPESRMFPNISDSRILDRESRNQKTESRGQGDLAHWSSHGYLAKEPETSNESGYVLLKRQQNDSSRQSPACGPQDLKRSESGGGRFELGGGRQESGVNSSPNKYFSVKGFQHMVQLHSAPEPNEKYFSVDASFLSGNSELKTNLRSNPAPQPTLEQVKPPTLKKPDFFAPPPLPPYQRPPPPKPESNLTSTKPISGSVSWLEWTQQLQAYVAWVNSQLRKREGLKPVKDLRTDLQTGEVLAQLIEIISGEPMAGIQYRPESLQGMRENLERVLQFMSSKQIKMHNISSRELLEGNLKSVMRLILALAAHYKPQSVKHHDTSTESIEPKKPEDSIPSTRPGEELRRPAPGRVWEQGENQRFMKRGEKSPKITTETQTLDSRPIDPSNFNRSNGPSPSDRSSGPSPLDRSIGPSPVNRGLNNEGFVRSGSGRKLPQIPERCRSNTLPSRKTTEGVNEEDEERGEVEEEEEHSTGGNKSKPKAMEFWESMENIERSDFRYNTIHRMSVGRRLLPKPPEISHSRSQSVDRDQDKISLNSSFSGPSSLPIHSVPQSPRVSHKIPPDGASLQSENSDLEQRRDGEGSSDKNSPPTSVVLGQGEILKQEKPNPAYDWVRGSFDQGRKPWSGYPGTEIDGGVERNVPYTILLQELNQAKKQLEELYNLNLPESSPGSLLKSVFRGSKADEVREGKEGFKEELQVAREAISNLRSMFRDSDPGHHILDTLEQCVSIIVEKASRSITEEVNENEKVAEPPTTKIIYFMPRSATPFMTSINMPVGQVSLRDFKAVFDRPGFYRYHIKNTDTEYGMVKEEIAEDDRILPGSSGKIVLWVEEE